MPKDLTSQAIKFDELSTQSGNCDPSYGEVVTIDTEDIIWETLRISLGERMSVDGGT